LSNAREQPLESKAVPRWLHYCAILTVCLSALLLALGAQVTTIKVGMADPDWPTAPWYLLSHSWWARGAGFLVEHSHRAAGYAVGCCCILLAAGVWLGQCSARMRWLTLLALLAVIIQGILGGFRVRLNELMGTELALVHGNFAQLVVALFVTIALLTSRGWESRGASGADEPDALRLRYWSLAVAGLFYAQLLMGGLVRHLNSPLGQRAHLLLAFVVVVVVTWLGKILWDCRSRDHLLTRAYVVMGSLLSLQILLGIETWISKYASGVLPELQHLTLGQSLVRSLHFVVGAGLFASSVAVVLTAHRQAVPAEARTAAHAPPMEPVA
jgi:cytochrome c oxidase assembly protein subunit 15